MINKDFVRLDGLGTRRAAHDRRASADVGYRVWNPFEAELRVDASGLQDEAAKGLIRAVEIFER